MYNGPYWIGYDNPESITTKVKYANFLDIAGVMMWSIDKDRKLYNAKLRMFCVGFF